MRRKPRINKSFCKEASPFTRLRFTEVSDFDILSMKLVGNSLHHRTVLNTINSREQYINERSERCERL